MQGKPIAEQEIGKLLLQETVSYAESSMCRRKTLLHYFGEEYTEENCGNCDNCRNPQVQRSTRGPRSRCARGAARYRRQVQGRLPDKRADGQDHGAHKELRPQQEQVVRRGCRARRQLLGRRAASSADPRTGGQEYRELRADLGEPQGREFHRHAFPRDGDARPQL